MSSSLSQQTLFEFLRSTNESSSSARSAHPVHRTPWIPPRNNNVGGLKFPRSEDNKQHQQLTALQRLANEAPSFSVSARNQQQISMREAGKGRISSHFMKNQSRLDENVKPPPMFEASSKERRGTKLNHIKGTSPQQLSKLKNRLDRSAFSCSSSGSAPLKLLSLDDLHRSIVSVNFMDLEGIDAREDSMDESVCSLQYDSLDMYKARQSQILLTETLEGFKQSLTSGYIPIHFGSPTNVFYSTINVTVTTAVRKGREWCLLTLKRAGENSSQNLTQGDVVLLMKPDSKLLDPLLRYGLGGGVTNHQLFEEKGAVLFGIVDRTKTSLLGSKQSKSVQLKCPLASKDCALGYSPSDAGVINSEWIAVVIHSLLTVEREWNGLCALRDEKAWFVPALLGKSNVRMRISKSFSSFQEEKQILGNLNESQRNAVLSAFDQPISIIQGPPGTGKTHTLVSLLKLYKTRNVKKIIVCAPSNAAVDELMLRFVQDTAAKPGSSIVRVGRNGSVSDELKNFSLDLLVMNSQAKLETDRYNEYKKRKSSLIDDIRKVTEKLIAGDSISGATKSQLNRAKERLKAQLDALKEREQLSVKVERDAIYKKYLSSAQFVFGTLSSLGAENIFSNLSDVDVCVIDEAAQAIEVSALIPLRFMPRGLVLVGDPQQLPAVVKSIAAKRARFDLSLMERLQVIGCVPTLFLSEQYRMDERISEFPSQQFYEGKLVTAPSRLGIPNPVDSLLIRDRPFVFIDTGDNSSDIKQGTSLINATEARIVADLVHCLVDLNLNVSIGVISPYKQQVLLLRKLLCDDTSSSVEVDSVDAFQGREKDVILFSCVRCSGNSVGFLSDTRRLNVAITRAKQAVWVVGNANFLRSHGGKVWEALVDTCSENRSIVTASKVEELSDSVRSNHKRPRII